MRRAFPHDILPADRVKPHTTEVTRMRQRIFKDTAKPTESYDSRPVLCLLRSVQAEITKTRSGAVPDRAYPVRSSVFSSLYFRASACSDPGTVSMTSIEFPSGSWVKKSRDPELPFFSGVSMGKPFFSASA